MDNRSRYEQVKSRLKVMGEGTAVQVHETMGEEVEAYSVREVESTLDELILHEKHEFEKLGAVYRWTKHYRFRTR
jgi:hypothetical protein